MNGRPPQEILVVEVEHRDIKVTHPQTVQTINDGGIPGVAIDDVGMGMGIGSLVGVRNRHFMNAIGILGNSRHGDR